MLSTRSRFVDGPSVRLGSGRGEAASLFEASGLLRQLGPAEDRGGGDFAASKTILKILGQRSADPDVLLGNAVPSSLKLDDFEHLGIAAMRCLAVVRGAMAANEKGIGVLSYGPPGTGKTEFARLMGQALRAHVVFVDEMGEDTANWTPMVIAKGQAWAESPGRLFRPGRPTGEKSLLPARPHILATRSGCPGPSTH